MSGSFSRMFRPTSDSLLDRWLRRRTPHPDAFRCGVRVIAGALAGESAEWRFALSGVDPLIGPDGLVSLDHGPNRRWRLRPDGDSLGPSAARPGWVEFAAREVDHEAELLISVD